MFHSWHRCGMKPLSVAAPLVEREFSEMVLSCLSFDDGWHAAILGALATEGPQPDHRLEMKRIEMALANLKKQHLWGAVTDEEFKTEYRTLARQWKSLELPVTPELAPNLERAAQLLRDMPLLGQHPGVTPKQRRDVAREVFQELRLKEGRLVAITPRPEYAPLFAYNIWRQNVVGGKHSS